MKRSNLKGSGNYLYHLTSYVKILYPAAQCHIQLLAPVSPQTATGLRDGE
jgi:hypothetical protein